MSEYFGSNLLRWICVTESASWGPAFVVANATMLYAASATNRSSWVTVRLTAFEISPLNDTCVQMRHTIQSCKIRPSDRKSRTCCSKH
jgi:hypothetical protein